MSFSKIAVTFICPPPNNAIVKVDQAIVESDDSLILSEAAKFPPGITTDISVNNKETPFGRIEVNPSKTNA